MKVLDLDMDYFMDSIATDIPFSTSTRLSEADYGDTVWSAEKTYEVVAPPYSGTEVTEERDDGEFSGLEISVGDMSFLLPKQEYRLMEQLMLNHKIYMSTEDLLIKAWGYNAETDINSVWLYISYLRKRLSAMNSKVEIVSKRNIGYKLELQQ